MTPRRVQRLDMPGGERVLDMLPTLVAALAGDGPALLPLDPRDPRADAIAAALGAAAPGSDMTTAATGHLLDDGEDDPADPTALVLPTSGSTGTPKGVLLSAGQLAASAAATEARLGGPGCWLLALPAHHIAGMQVLLRAARAGTDVVVLGGEKPFTATDFTRRAAMLPGPRRYVSLVPTQLQRVLADPEAAERTAEIFDAVLIGGSAIPPRLLSEARAAGIRAVTTYGMTETCGGCIYDGVPLDGVSVRLTSDGAIALTGPMVARGYRGQPGHPAFPAATVGAQTPVGPDSAEVSRLGPAAGPPGASGASRTFVTSDTGEITPDGRLRVQGRLDDIIVSGGLNVAPVAVEAAIRELPGVADVLVVGAASAEWGTEVVALVVPAPGGPSWEVTALRRALAEAGLLPAAHRPHRVITVAAIPLLSSGKPDRAAGRALAGPADRTKP